MPFKSLDELRAACLDLPAGSDAAASRRPPPGHADQAARQPRPAGDHRRLAGALAGPRHAEARPREGLRLRRQPWRHRAGRVGLPVGSHRADGGEFRRRRRRHQPACPHRRRRTRRHPARPRPSDRRLHANAGDGREGIPRRRLGRLRRGDERHSTSSASAKWASATPRRRPPFRPPCSAAARKMDRARHRRRRCRPEAQGRPPSKPASSAMPTRLPTR